MRMMARLRLLPIVAAAALALASVASAEQIRAVPRLPAGWSHAEINVTVRGVPHTLVYDRGRVLTVSASALTLHERDGSNQVINVSPASVVTILGRTGSLSQIRRGQIAITLRVDGGDATRVTVQAPLAVAPR
jgi:ribosomal protein S28E/S33